MTTTYKYKFGDFFGLTISGKYAYTIPLPEGGFTFDMYDTKQHPEPLHEDALYAIGYDLGGGQKRQKPIDVTDAEVDKQISDILRQKMAYDRLQNKAAAKNVAEGIDAPDA